MPLSDSQIAVIVREAAKNSAIQRDGSTTQRIARAIESAAVDDFLSRTGKYLTNDASREAAIADATAPLLAQIAALEAQLKTEQCLSFRDQVAQLEAQLAEARKDAERYRWLRDRTEWEPFDSKWLGDMDVYGRPTSEMDTAIDTAIAQELQNTEAMRHAAKDER